MQNCARCQARVSETQRSCPACGETLPGGPSGLGPYRLEAILVEGEHTTTYRARHRETGEAVAVVRFLDRLGEDRLAELSADVTRMQAIRGSRVIRIRGIQVTPLGEAYRVQDLVDGEPAPSLRRRGYFRSLENAVWFLIEMTRAVEEIHAADLLAPYLVLDDVLVANPGDPGARTVHVSYVGSRLLDPKTHHAGPSLERLLSHHPELACREPLSRLSGIYALGSLFHEVLTGEPPSEKPVYDPALRLPRILIRLVQRMLARDPGRRPQTTGEIVAELKKAQTAPRPPAPLTTDLPSLLEKASAPRRAIGRRVLLVLVLFVAVLVAVILLRSGTVAEEPNPFASVVAARGAVLLLQVHWEISGDDYRIEDRMTGTGFLVDPRTIVTARHVVAPWCDRCAGWNARAVEEIRSFKYTILVFRPDSRLYRTDEEGNRTPDTGEALEVDDRIFASQAAAPGTLSPAPDQDLAVIRLRKPLPVKPLTLAPATALESLPVGTELYLPSYLGGDALPAGENRVEPAPTSGRVAEVSPQDDSLSVDASNYKGSSGAPLIDHDARVVGVAVRAGSDDHHMTPAVGVAAVRRLLESVRRDEAARVWKPK